MRSEREAWNDERLDEHARTVERQFKELQKQLDRVTPTVESVAVLRRDMGAFQNTMEDLKKTQERPIKEAKERVTLTIAAVVGAMATGIVTVILFIVTKGKFH